MPEFFPQLAKIRQIALRRCESAQPERIGRKDASDPQAIPQKAGGVKRRKPPEGATSVVHRLKKEQPDS